MMLLRDLLKTLLVDKKLFLLAHNNPAVLIQQYSLEKTEGIVAQEAGFGTINLKPDDFDADTQRIDQSNVATLCRETDIDPDQDQVAWLAKSDRNPFTGMITVGRAGNNDLILPHSLVSKIQIIFRQQDGQWEVCDRGSTNGTVLNGRMLAPNDYCRIKNGDRLDLSGQISLHFFLPAALFELFKTLKKSSATQ